MAEKILYLLGAGASHQVLPLAKGLPSKLAKLQPDFTEQAFNSKLSAKFASLGNAASKHGDIDTYAKFLFIKGRIDELNQLKELLVLFFFLKQRKNQEVDTRYLSWLVGLLDSRKMPDNVKILSWNYDFQVQHAVSQIFNLEEIKLIPNGYSYIDSVFKSFPCLNPEFNSFKDLHLLQLNGTAAQYRMHGNLNGCLFTQTYTNYSQEIYKYYQEQKLQNNIRFAWESKNAVANTMNIVEPMIDGTTILVVIGYSFPFYNREFDKAIMNKLLDNNQFNKIYYQDPVLTGEQLKTQFDFQRQITIRHIRQTDNFHIPFEY